MNDSTLNKPFRGSRNPGRLLFDFGVMASLLNYEITDKPLLDFGAGTGWLSEFFVRMNMQVVSFDTDNDLSTFVLNRKNSDWRINQSIWTSAQGSGMALPFADSYFGHICTFDSFHYVGEYEKILAEMFRVLAPKGRAIFVEPGSRHESSPETIGFLPAQKEVYPSWIERGIFLEEINEIALKVGFKSGLIIIPTPHPSALQGFPLKSWEKFRGGNFKLRRFLTRYIAQVNYEERVIFYIEKP